jgi:plasmid stabilization system protein ParE
VRKLRDAAKRLEQFPSLGEVVHKFRRDDVREITFDNYRIIYQYGGGRLKILAVVHGARLLDLSMLGFE